jgi:hypothetical protein
MHGFLSIFNPSISEIVKEISQEALSFLCNSILKRQHTLLDDDIKLSIRFHAVCLLLLIHFGAVCAMECSHTHFDISYSTLPTFPVSHFPSSSRERGIYNQNIGSVKKIYTKINMHGSVSKVIMAHRFRRLPSHNAKVFLDPQPLFL